MSINMTIGLEAISNYRRLSYSPWYAIAEFVDNSTQSFFDNSGILQDVYRKSGDQNLEVSIVYSKDDDSLRISDTAMGMSLEELTRAMHIAQQPPNPTGRSRYGMGLKTSACWLGNIWSVRTKKYGDTSEHYVEIDVERISKGNGTLPYSEVKNKGLDNHYTVIEIRHLNHKFHGRTLGRIKDFLKSMYREDLRKGILTLLWNGDSLSWEDPELLVATDGSKYIKHFSFSVEGKEIHGWVGILKNGSRSNAGFSIIHSGRVIKGWPDSWRPESIFGQYQGSNDLVNQRLVGEIHLDGFEVSHTKDSIIWGYNEEEVEEKLAESCKDYREEARTARYKSPSSQGPSALSISDAIQTVEKEITSREMADAIAILPVPPPEAIEVQRKKTIEDVSSLQSPNINCRVCWSEKEIVNIKVFLSQDLHISAPYVTVESTKYNEVIVVINTQHPYWEQLRDSAVEPYIRECIYDAFAEWVAKKKVGEISPSTIKVIKDQLFRVPFEMVQNESG